MVCSHQVLDVLFILISFFDFHMYGHPKVSVCSTIKKIKKRSCEFRNSTKSNTDVTKEEYFLLFWEQNCLMSQFINCGPEKKRRRRRRTVSHRCTDAPAQMNVVNIYESVQANFLGHFGFPHFIILIVRDNKSS